MSLLLSCKYCRAGVELEEENHLGEECGRPGNGIGGYVFEKWLNVGYNHTSQWGFFLPTVC